ncbi:hypothetical protein KFF05_09970 [bacterium SCSIO 12827]|nr:hypothetical protein KFF05_09970 [bacterium SCSIO 12827]
MFWLDCVPLLAAICTVRVPSDALDDEGRQAVCFSNDDRRMSTPCVAIKGLSEAGAGDGVAATKENTSIMAAVSVRSDLETKLHIVNSCIRRAISQSASSGISG